MIMSLDSGPDSWSALNANVTPQEREVLQTVFLGAFITVRLNILLAGALLMQVRQSVLPSNLFKLAGSFLLYHFSR